MKISIFAAVELLTKPMSYQTVLLMSAVFYRCNHLLFVTSQREKLINMGKNYCFSQSKKVA